MAVLIVDNRQNVLSLRILVASQEDSAGIDSLLTPEDIYYLRTSGGHVTLLVLLLDLRMREMVSSSALSTASGGHPRLMKPQLHT